MIVRFSYASHQNLGTPADRQARALLQFMYLLPLLPNHMCHAAHVWPLAAFRRCCEPLYAAIVECRRAGVTITNGQHVADAGHMQTCIAADRSTTSAIAQAACAVLHARRL